MNLFKKYLVITSLLFLCFQSFAEDKTLSPPEKSEGVVLPDFSRIDNADPSSSSQAKCQCQDQIEELEKQIEKLQNQMEKAYSIISVLKSGLGSISSESQEKENKKRSTGLE